MGWNHQPVRGLYDPVPIGITISQYKERKLKSENWKPHPLIERGTLRVLKSSIFCTMARTYKPLFFVRSYIYIYTLGAGGSPKVLWVGFCEWLKIVISLWRNVSFWRSHSLHRIVFCADEIFLIRVLIDQKSIIHTFIFVRTCDLCDKMTILEMYDVPSVQKCCGPQYFWR